MHERQFVFKARLLKIMVRTRQLALFVNLVMLEFKLYGIIL